MSYLTRFSIWVFGSPFFLYECTCVLLLAVHYVIVIQYSLHALRFAYNLFAAARLVYLIHHTMRCHAKDSAELKRVLEEHEALVAAVESAKKCGSKAGKGARAGGPKGAGKAFSKAPFGDAPVHVCPQCAATPPTADTHVFRGPFGTEWQVPTSILPPPAVDSTAGSAFTSSQGLSPALRHSRNSASLAFSSAASAATASSPPPLPMTLSRLARSFVTCIWICVCLYLNIRVDPSLKQHIIPSLASSFHLWTTQPPSTAKSPPAQPTHKPATPASQVSTPPTPAVPLTPVPTAVPVPAAAPQPAPARRPQGIAAPRPAARSLGLSKRNKLATLARTLAGRSPPSVVPPNGPHALSPPAVALARPAIGDGQVDRLADPVVASTDPEAVKAAASAEDLDALEIASLPVFDTSRVASTGAEAVAGPEAKVFPPFPFAADSMPAADALVACAQRDALEIESLPVFDTSAAALTLAQQKPVDGRVANLDDRPMRSPFSCAFAGLELAETPASELAAPIGGAEDEDEHDGGSDSGVDDVTDDEEGDTTGVDARVTGQGAEAFGKRMAMPDSPLEPWTTCTMMPDVLGDASQAANEDEEEGFCLEQLVLDLSDPEVAAAAFIYALHAEG
ncbi:hypothetical protein BCR44DRAFT_25981 [Catenaria anguillulae PL171]|uniref:Uncharacterized protein n=1 Tax=Catenaria anguillulae PL171 TaxID=765915 RepID=A0A1Y2HCM4_9FUNG|nr:hypothetical protein BCR44DRAFT_25981 [Catenaria anguillulae PL171]